MGTDNNVLSLPGKCYEIKLAGQAENVIKLGQKTHKICKDLERIKKQQS
jgi:hypothetical protein